MSSRLEGDVILEEWPGGCNTANVTLEEGSQEARKAGSF